eukprot:PhF_6_TR35716/c0_g1_i3/m.51854
MHCLHRRLLFRCVHILRTANSSTPQEKHLTDALHQSSQDLAELIKRAEMTGCVDSNYLARLEGSTEGIVAQVNVILRQQDEFRKQLNNMDQLFSQRLDALERHQQQQQQTNNTEPHHQQDGEKKHRQPAMRINHKGKPDVLIGNKLVLLNVDPAVYTAEDVNQWLSITGFRAAIFGTFLPSGGGGKKAYVLTFESIVDAVTVMETMEGVKFRDGTLAVELEPYYDENVQYFPVDD